MNLIIINTPITFSNKKEELNVKIKSFNNLRS